MDYVTDNGWYVSPAMFNEIKEICPSLNLREILRLIDIMKFRELDSQYIQQTITREERKQTMNIDTRTVLQKAQDYTLGQVLSDWYYALTYDDIIRVLRSDAYQDGEVDVLEWVTPWRPYELLSGSQIADEIEGAVQNLVKLFGE